MSSISQYQVIVIGAGAAGFFAAIEAAKRGRKTLLVDHSTTIGEKIRISGGGRCNFTNVNAGPANYISENPHYCKSALSQYTSEDFVKLVESYHIRYYEKKLGQLFCEESAKLIINMLLEEADKYGVELEYPVRVNKIWHREINPEKFLELSTDYNFLIESSSGLLCGESVVIATGGLSIPVIGASDWGHKVAQGFGLGLSYMAPALVPFIAEGHQEYMSAMFCQNLAGLSIDTITSIGKQNFRENILFTHKGLSGPAILQISSYWRPGDSVTINYLPQYDLSSLLESFVELKRGRDSKKKLRQILREFFPSANRFTELFLDFSDFDKDQTIAEISKDELARLAQYLIATEFNPLDTEGYAKAEVTVGGVSTKYLDSKTMQAKLVPGLYFIGEVVDVTGWLGGYNFQWAWSSGFTSGQYA